MNLETKQCQNCKQNFVIEPEDFDFYKKINVPPPTWCPECRLQRRIVWRNIRSLNKIKCSAPGHQEDIISLYTSNNNAPVYCQDYWWSDNWNPIDYGRSYDFSLSFFAQFASLASVVPRPNITNKNAVNSEYAVGINIKNCYLVSSALDCENCSFSQSIYKSKDCLDSYNLQESELCYECINCTKSSRLSFCYNSHNCLDSSFLSNCRNCRNCFGCVNLRNKQYYIFNEQCTKDRYKKEILKINSGNYSGLQDAKLNFKKVVLNNIHKYANLLKCQNVIGDYVENSKNSQFCFDSHNLENSKFINWSHRGGSSNYDLTVSGSHELSYDGSAVGSGYNVLFSILADDDSEIQNSYFCLSSSHLFGCIGLRNKQYCILNKQYTKEEYEELVPKIIKHMNDMPYIDSKGRVYKYGEFFPPELSPFAYNETIAQEYFPLTKEEAISQGYRWKDPEERSYEIEVMSNELPDHMKDVTDDIVGKVIECKNSSDARQKGRGRSPDQDASRCTEAFKIIEPELQFYRRMNLPLPRLCPNCRHYQRLKQRNPLKLWHRKCQCGGTKSSNGIYINTIQHQHGDTPCPNEFETSYSPERPEIVYCEQCYNQEVV